MKKFFVLWLVSLVACVSQQRVTHEYQDALKKNSTLRQGRVVVYILVDGLPVRAISDELNEGRLPHIYDFFISKTRQFYVARVPFPSLTYPSISSLLASAPVDQTGIYGNSILLEGKKLNFEIPNDYQALNDLIATKTNFARLSAMGKRTASFDYVFHAGSTVHTDTSDVEAGFAFQQKNYYYIDSKAISSLDLLLHKTPVEEWPDFIFLHVVGVDLFSHDLGPRSVTVKQYLEKLDSAFEPIFRQLKAAEESGSATITTLLSSDHGFDEEVTKISGLEEELKKSHPDIYVINEGRYLSLFFPRDMTPQSKGDFARSLSVDSSVDIVAYTDGPRFQVLNKNTSRSFDGTLSDDALSEFNNLYYPYFVPNMAHYFKAKGHPDVVVISRPGVSYISKYKGQHGGPTIGETFVPLLIRGGTINKNRLLPPVWDVLKFL